MPETTPTLIAHAVSSEPATNLPFIPVCDLTDA